MKKILVLIIGISIISFCGCANVRYPLQYDNLEQEFTAFPDRFEVLGEVKGSASNFGLLGLLELGDAGYIAAIDDAKSQKKGADALINVRSDMKKSAFLWYVFVRHTTIVKGIAIKRKK